MCSKMIYYAYTTRPSRLFECANDYMYDEKNIWINTTIIFTFHLILLNKV